MAIICALLIAVSAILSAWECTRAAGVCVAEFRLSAPQACSSPALCLALISRQPSVETRLATNGLRSRGHGKGPRVRKGYIGTLPCKDRSSTRAANPYHPSIPSSTPSTPHDGWYGGCEGGTGRGPAARAVANPCWLRICLSLPRLRCSKQSTWHGTTE